MGSGGGRGVLRELAVCCLVTVIVNRQTGKQTAHMHTYAILEPDLCSGMLTSNFRTYGNAHIMQMTSSPRLLSK